MTPATDRGSQEHVQDARDGGAGQVAEVPEVPPRLLAVARQHRLEEVGDEEEDGVAQPHGDEHRDDPAVERPRPVALHEERGRAPGPEQGGDVGGPPGAVRLAAGGPRGERALAPVPDEGVVLLVVRDLLEGPDLGCDLHVNYTCNLHINYM